MLPKHLPARATITLALATLVVVLAGIVPQQVEAQSRRYRTRDGGTLPFATDAQILLALREGEIVKEETLGSGTTGVKRLEIRYEGIVMRAAFRHMDVYERNIRLATAAISPVSTTASLPSAPRMNSGRCWGST